MKLAYDYYLALQAVAIFVVLLAITIYMAVQISLWCLCILPILLLLFMLRIVYIANVAPVRMPPEAHVYTKNYYVMDGYSIYLKKGPFLIECDIPCLDSLDEFKKWKEEQAKKPKPRKAKPVLI